MLKRLANHLYPVLAALLGIAAIAAAFAGFHAGERDDESKEAMTAAVLAGNSAFSLAQQATEQRNRDESLFLEYEKAYLEDNRDVYRHIRVELMDGNLRRALRDYENPDSPVMTPLKSPKYENEFADQADELFTEMESLAGQSEERAELSGRYEVVVVILSVALFFFGIAGVLRAMRLRLAVTGAGVAILAVSLGLLGAAYF